MSRLQETLLSEMPILRNNIQILFVELDASFFYDNKSGDQLENLNLSQYLECISFLKERTESLNSYRVKTPKMFG